MVEPITMTALAALGASEGIKFLYGQAAEVLKRWRDRKAGREAEAGTAIPVDQAAAQKLLVGKLDDVKVDFEVLERLHDVIKTSAGLLSDYVGGLEEPTADDRELSEAVDTLRSALEAVYSQRITFKGESRPPSGPAVISLVEVDEVAGRVLGVRAGQIRGGTIDSTVKTGTVAAGGEAVGVDADTIG